MKIICTVKEFGQIVRACENTSKRLDCRSCPLNELCDRVKSEKIEQFISAADVVEDEAVDVLREFFAKEGVSDG